MNDRLLYGKNETKRIVSLEVKDQQIELFIRNENEELKKEYLPNKYWILTNDSNSNWNKLKGNNFYQYGKKFDSREEFEQKRRQLKQSHDIYSIFDPKESAMVLNGICYYKGLKPADLAVLSFDLETTGLFHNKDSKVLLISNTFRHKGIITKKLFCYDEFENEGEMLEAWCAWVRKMDPDLITGHNINGFDFGYIQFCAKRSGIKLRLGRDNSPLKIQNYESKFRKDGSQELHYFKSHIYGREIIDTLFLAIRYDVVAKKHPTYGLKAVIKAEGLEKANRAFYDASKIRQNYTNPIEWEKIKDYCWDDSDDALALFDLFAPPYFYMTTYIPKPFQLVTESATGSQINSILLRSYLQEGHSIPKANEINDFQGAISFAVPGIYKNMMKIDFSGLYPSIMRQFKVFNKGKDPEENFLKLLNYFAEYRLKYKKLYKETGEKYYDDMQQASKIFANSMYGFLSTPGINFNYPEGAAFITAKGRELLTTSIEWATNKTYEYWSNLSKEKTK